MASEQYCSGLRVGDRIPVDTDLVSLDLVVVGLVEPEYHGISGKRLPRPSVRCRRCGRRYWIQVCEVYPGRRIANDNMGGSV